MYHLPLLPGYGPNANIRSSVPAVTTTGKSFLAHLSEAEENGYQGTYFTSQGSQPESLTLREGYISSSSPVASGIQRQTTSSSPPIPDLAHEGMEQYVQPLTPASDTLPIITTTSPDIDPGAETDPGLYNTRKPTDDVQDPEIPPPTRNSDEDVAEVVFFAFGVAVFFGLEERQERDILEDIANAGIVKRPLDEDDWEIEEYHFAVCFFKKRLVNSLSTFLYSTIHISLTHESITTFSVSLACQVFVKCFLTIFTSTKISVTSSQTFYCSRSRTIVSSCSLRNQRTTGTILSTHIIHTQTTSRVRRFTSAET